MFTKVTTAALLLFSSSLALAQARDGAMLENADTDHDGKVTRQEYTNARAEQFAKLDRNGDGVVDDSDSGGRAGKRGAALRARLDTNSDGKLTKEEFVNGPTPMFEQFDANHDGVLDAQELAAARSAAKERIRDRRQQ
jgi:Ca2+-binding EF-hand superfamily protein